MQIVIKTPEELEDERIEMLRKAIKILRKQSRSCDRYATRLQWHLNRIEELNYRIGDTK